MPETHNQISVPPPTIPPNPPDQGIMEEDKTEKLSFKAILQDKKEHLNRSYMTTFPSNQTSVMRGR